MPSNARPQTSVYQAYYDSSPDQFSADLAKRPDHYTDAQIQSIRALEQGEHLENRELIDLVLQHQRRAVPAFEKPKAVTPPKPALPSIPKGPIKRLSI